MDAGIYRSLRTASKQSAQRQCQTSLHALRINWYPFENEFTETI